jgi:hypothetical protein
MFRYLALVAVLAPAVGCQLFPDISHQPTLHNPFPQLAKVAVAPFFNQSTEPTLDSRRVALAYFAELQSVPGFEVVPVGVVERAMLDYGIQLTSPAEARRLAQLLGVDALVVGAVTDYTPYYPPRMGLHVEWYAANPCFHPIPPGYGLPWGTPEEECIPAPLVFEAEMALAKAQLKTQTPTYRPDEPSPQGDPPGASPPPEEPEVRPLDHEETVGADVACRNAATTATGPDCGPLEPGMESMPGMAGLPPDWPNPCGFMPPPPLPRPPTCWPSEAPVMRHTGFYTGNDADFTEALASYYYFRDDARFGGWQSYLDRSEDFLRFCCHMHICETLSARGGAGETRVVWRWPTIR